MVSTHMWVSVSEIMRVGGWMVGGYREAYHRVDLLCERLTTF